MKPIIASHTFLDTFERCPKQAWHKYVAKDLPFVETEQMRWGTRVHKALEHRVKDKTPLPEDMKPYEKFAAVLDGWNCHVEAKLGMTINGRGTGFFSDNVWCRGKVDVATTQGPICVILDWKTGKPREDEAELERFAYMLRANNDELKYFSGRYVWLKEDRIGQEHVLDPDARLTKDKRLMDQVGALQKNGVAWPAHENGLCRNYCDVVSCPHNGKK